MTVKARKSIDNRKNRDIPSIESKFSLKYKFVFDRTVRTEQLIEVPKNGLYGKICLNLPINDSVMIPTSCFAF